MAAEKVKVPEKCFFESMKFTILKCNVEERKAVDYDAIVEKRVREIISSLTTENSKFRDPEFGPKDDEDNGANSLYGPNGPPPGYPDPKTIRWVRPKYADTTGKFRHLKQGDNDEEEDDEDDDEEDDDDEFSPSTRSTQDKTWCTHGELFIGGSSSGDVIQGKVGDCWFMAALSVVGTDQALLRNCFWRSDTYQEHGLFVCIFHKECSIFFVIIDDRIPMFETSGKITFGQCRDPNELWVPLLEKAYAKLHGCYRSLIAGDTHIGIGDLTGFPPRFISLVAGTPGYSETLSADQLWETLVRYRSWGSLLGCSIQGSGKAEQDAGNGLLMRHAYSLLDVREFKAKDGKSMRLVRMRNPHGRGEWTGPWGDESREFAENEELIKAAFFDKSNEAEGVEKNRADGTFCMTFDDWRNKFSKLFIAIRFPTSWFGRRYIGQLNADQGGYREKANWMNNPKVKISVPATRRIFVGIYIRDPRLFLGKEYVKDPMFTNMIGFDVVRREEFDQTYAQRLSRAPDKKDPVIVDGHLFTADDKPSLPDRFSKQPPYLNGSTQVESEIAAGEYYIVPSMKVPTTGPFYLYVYADGDFEMEGGVRLDNETKPLSKLRETTKSNTPPAEPAAATTTTAGKLEGKSPAASASTTTAPTTAAPQATTGAPRTTAVAATPALPSAPVGSAAEAKKEPALIAGTTLKQDNALSKLTLSQFREKKENIRTRIVTEATKKGITMEKMTQMFTMKVGKKGLTRQQFKLQMIELGFTLADFPDDDFIVLDEDASGVIDPSEFLAFFKEGLRIAHSAPPPPEEPVDDLLYQPMDLEGIITVKVFSGRNLRKLNTWFSVPPPVDGPGKTPATVTTEADALRKLTRPIFKYDVKVAEAARKSSKLMKFFDDKRKEAVALSTARSVDSKRTEDNKSLMKTASAYSVRKAESKAGVTDSYWKDAPSTLDSDAGFDAKSEVGISLTKEDEAKCEAIGQDIGKKLHTDKTLIDMEVMRVKFLRQQKARAALLGSEDKDSGASSILQASKLRKKTRPKGKKPSLLSAEGRDELLTQDWLIDYLEIKVPKSPGPGKADEKKEAIDTKGKDYKGATVGNGVSNSSKQAPKVEPKSLHRDLKQVEYIGEHDLQSTREPTFWDFLIDCVYTITTSKSTQALELNTVLAGDKGKLKSSHLLKLEPQPSQGPTPGSARPMKPRSGTIATPRNRKSTTDLSSVNSRGTASQQQKTLQDAKDKLKVIQDEPVFEEVYRTLLAVPVIDRNSSNPGTHSDETSGFAAWFRYFDKNNNGTISSDEFSKSLMELNLTLSDEDVSILFARFQTNVNDNIIDWKEFVSFFDNNIQRSLSDGFTTTNSTDVFAWNKNRMDLLILRLKKAVTSAYIGSKSARSRQNTPRKDPKLTHAHTHGQVQVQVETVDERDIPYNFIFPSIALQEAKGNVQRLRDIGFNIEEEEMGRISRIFEFDVVKLMTFIRGTPSNKVEAKMNGEGERVGEVDLISAMNLARDIMLKSFLQRGGGVVKASTTEMKSTLPAKDPKLKLPTISEQHEMTPRQSLLAWFDGRETPVVPTALLPSLWRGFATRPEDSIEFDDVSRYLDVMVEDYLHVVESHVSGQGQGERGQDSTPKLEKLISTPKLRRNSMSEKALKAGLGKASQPDKSERKPEQHDHNHEGLHSGHGVNGHSHGHTHDHGDDDCLLFGVATKTLCRLIVDEMIYNPWNKSSGAISNSTSASTTVIEPSIDVHTLLGRIKLRNLLSYAGFQAFLCQDYISTLERKLRYLIFLDAGGDVRQSTSLLLHVYFSSKNEEVLIIGRDPVLGQIYKIQFKEDVTGWVRGDGLFNDWKKLYLPLYQTLNTKYKIDPVNPNVLYNPWEFPLEDNLIHEMCKRLRLIKSGRSLKLHIAEDEKFVNQLRDLLEKANLPFFTVCDQTRLGFECCKEAAKEAGSLRKLVFSSIKAYNPLLSFLTNVYSSLDVVLSVYDSTERELIEWTELLAHLNGYRNPFLAIQLYPQFIEPKLGAPIQNEEDIIEIIDDTEGDQLLKRCKPDTDGGSIAIWNSKFNFEFQPPKLTSCKILFQEVVKLKAQEKSKYFIVMARLGKDSSIFLTAYDPRSSTEYQCGVSDEAYKAYPKISDWKKSDVYDVSKTDEYTTLLSQVASFGTSATDKKSVGAEGGQNSTAVLPTKGLVLGPAITPRIVVTLMNARGTTEQYLGTAQVSISSLMSGVGNTKSQWVTVLTDGPGAVSAGEVHLEVSFTRKMEIEAKEESKKNRKKREKSRIQALTGESSQTPTTVTGNVKSGTSDEFNRERANLLEQIEALKKEKTKQAKNLSEALISLQKEKSLKNTSASSNSTEKALEDTQTKLKQAEAKQMDLLNELTEARKKTQMLEQSLEEARRKEKAQSAAKSQVEKSSEKAPQQAVVLSVPAPVPIPHTAAPKDSALSSVVGHIVEGFRHRNEAKPTKDPFRALEKMLNNEHGEVSFREIRDSLEDLLIQISDEQAEILGRHVGSAPGSKSTKSVSVTSLLKYLREQYDLGSSEIPRAAVDSARREEQKAEPRATVEKKPTKIPTLSTELGQQQQQQSLEEIPTYSSKEWERVELPPGEELRKDAKGRTYYVNHEERATYWYHPLDPRRAQERKKRVESLRTSQQSSEQDNRKTRPTSATLRGSLGSPQARSRGGAGRPTASLSSSSTSNVDDGNGTIRRSGTADMSTRPSLRAPRRDNFMR